MAQISGIDNKIILRELKETFIIFLIGVPWGYFNCLDCGYMTSSIIISGVIWVLLAKGNGYVSDFISHKVGWLEAPFRRLTFGILGHIVYTILAVLLLYYSLDIFFDIQLGGIEGTLRISVIITLIIATILTSREFLLSWRKVAVDHEKVKKEAADAKYESLRNQVNPHFLFNSFNVLTDLVYEDQDLAAKFIKKLSDIYRYVLEVRDKKLVSINEEVEFINSYIFLLKIRHGNALIVDNNLNVNSRGMIAPMSLQFLVENCIKHNIISQEDPLKVSIRHEGDYLVVVNNLQLRNNPKSDHSGVGLNNIKSRYDFITDKKVQISESGGIFSVKIPIIQSE